MVPSASSIVAVLLRGGWEIGAVLDRYLRYSEAGDEFVGRVLSGLPLNDASFTSRRHSNCNCTARPANLGDGKAQLVELVHAHLHSSNGAIRQGDLEQDERSQDAGTGSRGDADADAPSNAGEARLRYFVGAAKGGTE